jgi:hypothetical protein
MQLEKMQMHIVGEDKVIDIPFILEVHFLFSTVSAIN